MATDIKGVFDEHVDVKIDTKLVKKVIAFVQGFANKTSEHTNFFGGHLFGVYRPTWNESVDSVRWLEEVCGIYDIDQCQDDVYDVDGINPTFNISSNITNLSFLYMAYRIHTSDLSSHIKEEGVIHCIIASHMKHLTGGHRRRCQYPSNLGVAMAHFESLDYRSDLKRLGSWMALIRNRGEQVLEKDFIRRKQLETFKETEDIVRWANALQDLLMDVLNALATSFYATHAEEKRILSSGALRDLDGDMSLVDKRSVRRDLIKGIAETFASERAFIKENLIAATLTVVNTSDERLLKETLTYLSQNYKHFRKDLDKLSVDAVIFLFEIARENNIPLTDVPRLVVKARDLFRSSQVKRSDVITLKAFCRKVVDEAIPRARQNYISATTVAMFIYILLRIIVLQNEK